MALSLLSGGRKRPTRPLFWALSAALLASSAGVVHGFEVASQFLIISSPSTGNVYYSKLPGLHEQALFLTDRPAAQAYILIDGKDKCTGYGCSAENEVGLQSPQGLAVHEGESLSKATLFVSDPKASSIFAYELTKSDFGWLSATSQHKVLQNVVASGLATDGFGNLFYTVTDSGEVNMLTTAYLAKAAAAAASGSTLPEPEVVRLYNTNSKGANGAAVVQPVGIAADNFFVYWANQGGDEATGSVIKAPDAMDEEPVAAAALKVESRAGEEPTAVAATLQAIAANTEYYQAVASNVCLARDTVFFTGETHSLYAVKRTGGLIAEVTKNFTEPRGCVYDKQGALYVADSGANAVFSLAADFSALRAVRYVTRAVEVPGPEQIVVFGAATLQSLGARVAVPAQLLLLVVLGVTAWLVL